MKHACWLSVAMCVVGGTVRGDSVTNTWKEVTANMPQTAYAWTEPSNWYSIDRGVPDGLAAGVEFAYAHDGDVFIKMPDNLTLGYLRTYAGGDRTYLLGDKVTVDSSVRAVLNGGPLIIYADVDLKVSDNRFGNGGDVQVAGDLSFSGESGRVNFNGVSHRFDLFAKQAGEKRNSEFAYSAAVPWILGKGYFIYAPHGSAEQKSVWNQTEGSPYLQLAGAKHELAVGTLVTGDGIPDNAFLKRILGDQWIELSIAATKTKASNELTFAAFTPEFTETIGSLTMAPYTARIAVFKRRAVDQAKLSCGSFAFGTSGGSCDITFGLTDAEVESGYFPGTIDFLSVSTPSAAKGSMVELANGKLLLTGKNGIIALTGLNVSCATAASQVELCVPASTTASIDSFVDVNGTVTKTGAGSLSIKVTKTVNGGTLAVSEGELAIEDATGASGPLVFAALDLAAGSTFVIPAAGVSVGRLTADKNASVSGGKLTVTGSVVGLPIPANGAEISVPVRDCSVAVVPTQGRWLHLDACQADKFDYATEGDGLHITKWYDASGSGCYAYADASNPWFRENASNGHPMIDLGAAVYSKGTGSGGTGAAITSRGLSLHDAEGSTFSGIHVQSAFYVVDSSKGGGALLSQTGSNFPQYGVPHWPENGLGVAPILGFKGSTNGNFQNADIRDGSSTFRTNGITIYPRSTPFSGGIDIVSFTNNAALHAKVTGSAIGRVIGGGASYDKSANGLAFGEVILFSNGVSSASMLDIEAYLAKKWFGRKTEGYYLTVDSLGGMTDANSKVSVSGGGTIETAELVTGGTIEGGVELQPNGCIEAAVAQGGGISTLTVNGTLSLPTEIVVRLTGSFNKLKGGDYDLLTATAFAGVTQETLVRVEEPAGATRSFSAKIVGNKVVLTVVPPGVILIVR